MRTRGSRGERLDARELGRRPLRALLDHHDLEAVVILREQRGQQLGERAASRLYERTTTETRGRAASGG